MRRAFLFLALVASPAFAQLQSVLAPVSEAPVAAQDRTGLTSPPSNAAKAKQTVTPAEILDFLEKDLAAHFSLEGELKLSLLRPLPPIPQAEGMQLEVTEYPTEGISSSFVVQVRALDGQGEWQIALRAQLWQEVWVAATRLNRGQPLDRSLLTATRVDVVREREVPVAASVNPSTLEVAQAVPAGRPLARRDVSERPVVRKNQVVEVTAGHGLLSLNMKALALENGAAGARIRLRNLDSHKEFTAQVSDTDHVQVQF